MVAVRRDAMWSRTNKCEKCDWTGLDLTVQTELIGDRTKQRKKLKDERERYDDDLWVELVVSFHRVFALDDDRGLSWFFLSIGCSLLVTCDAIRRQLRGLVE